MYVHGVRTLRIREWMREGFDNTLTQHTIAIFCSFDLPLQKGRGGSLASMLDPSMIAPSLQVSVHPAATGSRQTRRREARISADQQGEISAALAALRDAHILAANDERGRGRDDRPARPSLNVLRLCQS